MAGHKTSGELSIFKSPGSIASSRTPGTMQRCKRAEFTATAETALDDIDYVSDSAHGKSKCCTCSIRTVSSEEIAAEGKPAQSRTRPARRGSEAALPDFQRARISLPPGF